MRRPSRGRAARRVRWSASSISARRWSNQSSDRRTSVHDVRSTRVGGRQGGLTPVGGTGGPAEQAKGVEGGDNASHRCVCHPLLSGQGTGCHGAVRVQGGQGGLLGGVRRAPGCLPLLCTAAWEVVLICGLCRHRFSRKTARRNSRAQLSSVIVVHLPRRPPGPQPRSKPRPRPEAMLSSHGHGWSQLVRHRVRGNGGRCGGRRRGAPRCRRRAVCSRWGRWEATSSG